jgi:ferredoxin
VKTRIFYFTGSGNCLIIARKLGAALGTTSIQSIARATETDVGGGRIGIVSPIYMYDMPHVVIDYIKRIKRADSLFFVYAGGGEPGGGLRKVKRLCRKQQLPLSGVYSITMPSNYTPFGYPDETRQRSLLDGAEEAVKAIADKVSRGKEHFDKTPTSFFRSYVHPGILYRLGHSQIKRMDRGFSCDETCNGCKSCVKICPVHNISIREGYPHWHHHCEQCFACLIWCPREAIQYRNRTNGVKRYRHPDVTMRDIIESAHSGE